MTNAKAECEGLMNAVVPFAEKMLSDHGEFFPYGGAMTPTREVVSVATPGDREQPLSAELIGLIKEAFVEGARQGEYDATALVYDARVVVPRSGQKSDAVAVSLNHREQYSVVVYIPYKRSGKKVVFGEIFAGEGDADIFPAAAGG